MAKKLEKLSRYTIDEVFSAFHNSGRKAKFNNAPLKCQRIRNFIIHGTSCVRCGIKGSIFVVEKHNNDKSPHLNLYALKGSREILMTRDHIKPTSLGGQDCLHNLQPMCSKCNMRKSDRWTFKDKIKHFISFVNHKLKGYCDCSFKEAI